LRRNLLIVFLLLTACAITGCATAPPQSTIATSIDAAIRQPPFQHAFWSMLVVDDQGKVLYANNADKLTIPASNRKLYAAATIVDCLGVDGQLVTEIWRDGDDLVLRGDGDPSFGSWRYERDHELDALVDSLRARGVTRVRDVIADVSLFDRTIIPGGWKYGNLGTDYSAPVDALAWGENELPGDRAVPDPALYAATTLRDALVLRGIAVTGVPRTNTEPRAWGEKLASIPSPFIGQLLTTVLKNSHNLYAEMLLKRAGGGTYEGAFAKERAFLTGTPKLDGDAFRFVDGSGLAPDDLVTPQSTVKLLRWMNEPVRRAFWWAVMATPNEEGTLHHRLVTLENRLRGKTGTINGVNALSGILAMPDGSYRYFSIMVNHHAGDSDEAVRMIDGIVAKVAER
jgi:D-alanyl-D-alanine carboxypeptidase/D-alanyl-D-alanine-endopeptidase (penicillin-binding protein 4)